MPWDCQSIQFWLKIGAGWNPSAHGCILLGSVEMSRSTAESCFTKYRGNRQQQPARLLAYSRILTGNPFYWDECTAMKSGGCHFHYDSGLRTEADFASTKKALLGKLWETHRAGEARHSAPEVVGLQLVRWVGLLWCISWSFDGVKFEAVAKAGISAILGFIGWDQQLDGLAAVGLSDLRYPLVN